MYGGAVDLHQKQENKYPIRRTMLTIFGVVATGAILTAAIPSPVRDFLIGTYERINNPNILDDRYFEALKVGDNIFIGYQGRVFEIVSRFPKQSRGMQFLVKQENLSYDRAKLEVIGKLAEQLYKNPRLKTLIPKQIERIHFDHRKKVGFLDLITDYPIPKQIPAKSLDELVK